VTSERPLDWFGAGINLYGVATIEFVLIGAFNATNSIVSQAIGTCIAWGLVGLFAKQISPKRTFNPTWRTFQIALSIYAALGVLAGVLGVLRLQRNPALGALLFVDLALIITACAWAYRRARRRKDADAPS
jgi:carbon starvation protein CstA